MIFSFPLSGDLGPLRTVLNQAKDLVYRMLKVDVEKRATMAEVLDHPVSQSRQPLSFPSHPAPHKLTVKCGGDSGEAGLTLLIIMSHSGPEASLLNGCTEGRSVYRR